MKYLLNAALAVSILFYTACCPKYIPSNSGQVTYISAGGDGTITLSAKGFADGKQKNKAITDAKDNAIKALLFRGVPGSALNTAMIGNENKARSEHAAYLNNLIENGGYSKFITSETLTNYSPSKCYCSAEILFTINYQALKTDLLQNKVVPKYGIN